MEIESKMKYGSIQALGVKPALQTQARNTAPSRIVAAALVACTLSVVFWAAPAQAQVHVGDLTLSSQTDVDTFAYTEVTGYLRVIDDADGTDNISNLNGLSELTSVGGDLWVVNIDLLTNLDGLRALTSVGGDLIIHNIDLLTNLDGLRALTSVGGEVWIDRNPLLTSLDGLSALTSVGEGLYIWLNASLDRFCGLFPLLDGGGLVGVYSAEDNLLNPTEADILAQGPCILDPVKEIAVLIAAVDVLGLAQGLENSLLSKLNNALAKLLDGNPNNDHAACNQLAAFINQVDAQSGKKIDPLDADALIVQAMTIIDMVCP
jgi:hypothetical protein